MHVLVSKLVFGNSVYSAISTIWPGEGEGDCRELVNVLVGMRPWNPASGWL